jgi:hypothetical protein
MAKPFCELTFMEPINRGGLVRPFTQNEGQTPREP